MKINSLFIGKNHDYIEVRMSEDKITLAKRKTNILGRKYKYLDMIALWSYLNEFVGYDS